MDYIFFNALRTDKIYRKSNQYLLPKLNEINDLQLIYEEKHKITDISFKEKQLIYFLDKLEDRKTWLRVLLYLISFLSTIQFVSVIYVAFIQTYLNSDQVNLLVMSAIISILSIGALFLEHRKFQKNKYEALKLFLIVKNHNYLEIIKEREAVLNPRVSYEKGTPMDYIFGSDDD